MKYFIFPLNFIYKEINKIELAQCEKAELIVAELYLIQLIILSKICRPQDIPITPKSFQN